MDMLKKKLEQREKPELIAIIQHMLRQEPELQWLLMMPSHKPKRRGVLDTAASDMRLF